MFTKLGRYKTFSGHIATVAQLRSQGQNHWILIGSLRFPDDNVECIHTWTAEGKSLANPGYSLTEFLSEETMGVAATP